MANAFSSAVSTLQKCLRLYSYRRFSSDIKGSWNKAPMCKGDKISKPKKFCLLKEMSCNFKMGECTRASEPECSKLEYVPKDLACCNNSRLAREPCYKPPEKKSKPKEEEITFKSMWDVGLPPVEHCAAFIERLDEKYYEPSDKEKRCYTRTWKPCVDVIRKTKVCCFKDICSVSPPFEKRIKSECPDTASEQDSEKLKVDYKVLKKCMDTMSANSKATLKCRKIKMPCCMPVAKTVKCFQHRPPLKCMKSCCPYPSFSECLHAELQKGKPIECKCLNIVEQCCVNRYNYRRQMFTLPPAVPAWPPKERPK